jgi:DNA-binding protein H-NS
MKRTDFNSLSLDELSALHDKVAALLTSRLNAEKRLLEKRLASLQSRTTALSSDNRQHRASSERRVRRYYPEVVPKYRNPADPSETWAGRGKQPRWLRAQLQSGKRIENFLIDQAGRRTQRKRLAR